jgi:hypothetical protein
VAREVYQQRRLECEELRERFLAIEAFLTLLPGEEKISAPKHAYSRHHQLLNMNPVTGL